MTAPRGCSRCARPQPTPATPRIRQGERQAIAGYPQGGALDPHRIARAGCLAEQPEAPTGTRETAGRTERDSRRDSAPQPHRVSGAGTSASTQPSAHTGAVDNPIRDSRPGARRHQQPRTVTPSGGPR